MITLTIVRHGESEDNLRPVWAGWADAPLSAHGKKQAEALGKSYRSTQVDAIYASDLLRAHWTAQQIHGGQSEPQPPLTVSPLLRERHFGKAERQTFDKFVCLPDRQFKFEEGESLEDVRGRAHEAISQWVEPALRESHGRAAEHKHIVVVAHGIFNSEFLGAIMTRRPGSQHMAWSYRGMTNTGWTRLELGYEEEISRAPTPHIETDPKNVNKSSVPSAAPPGTPGDNELPRLVARVLLTDVTEHLNGLQVVENGAAQNSDVRAFFSGATTRDVLE